ncbi:hypothetical protein Mapa_004095 [Marchantia paleacea]|nr:hypothetical protein Mapa_004095 [Marchantia paleacea]
MAISLDELFSDKYSTAVVATAVAAAAEAAAAEETPEAVSPPEAQKEVKEAAKEEVKEEPKEEVIELKVPICCEGCVEKMEKKLILMEGVVGVECDVEKQKVTVRGTAKPEAVLKKARKIQKRSDLWKD